MMHLIHLHESVFTDLDLDLLQMTDDEFHEFAIAAALRTEAAEASARATDSPSKPIEGKIAA